MPEMSGRRSSYFKAGMAGPHRDFTNCAYCGVDLKSLKTPSHFDHIIPVSRGGSNHRNNVLLVCQTCNLTKGPRSLSSMRQIFVQKKLGWPQFSIKQLSWLRAAGFDMTPFDTAKLWFEEEHPP